MATVGAERASGSPGARSHDTGEAAWASKLPAWIPRGQGLAATEWTQRHAIIVAILWLHIPLLVAFGMYGGLDRWISYARYDTFGYAQPILEGLVIALFAGLASWNRLGHRFRSASAALGLITCSAVLVQFSGGFIEAHFHFFAILGLLALYEDWTPFLLAVGYVLVHHGTVGTIAPGSVYNHPAAIAHPWRWAGIHAFFVAGLCSFLIVNWSVTERARLETQRHARAAEQALSLHRATLESTADGILVVDTEGAIQTYNERFQEMWGIPDEVVEARDDETALAYVLEKLEDPEGFLAKVKALYASPDAESQDRIEFKDGRIFERTSQPQKLGDRTVGRVWSFRDITATVRSQEQLQAKAVELEDANLQLARSNEDLRQFAYVASHDLSEPLRTIASYVQLIQARKAESLDEEAQEFLEFVVDGALQMRRRIDGLLEYSRVENRELVQDRVELGDVVDAALANLDHHLEDTGATVHRGPLPVVLGDETQLTQLFENLLSNALKFSTQDPTIEIRATRVGSHWRIEVHDDGIGIEPAYQERIFTIFERLHSRERFEGTGIGLAVCKRIVERHGGEIGVESKPGGGAMFHFTLPAGSERESAPAPRDG